MRPLQLLSSLCKTFSDAQFLDLCGAASLLGKPAAPVHRAISLPSTEFIVGYAVKDLAAIVPEPRAYDQFHSGDLAEFAVVLTEADHVVKGQAFITLNNVEGMGRLDPAFTFDAIRLTSGLQNEALHRSLVGDFFRPVYVALCLLASGDVRLQEQELDGSRNERRRGDKLDEPKTYLTLKAV